MNQPYDIDLKAFNFNQSMDPNDIQSQLNGDSQKSPNQKEDWIQWSRILHFAWLPVKQYRSDKHSMASMLLLWYWRDDSDDCNYIILHSECDGKFVLEWTIILAICLICNSHHSLRWHLELLEFQYRLAFYYQGSSALCRSYIKLPLHSLFYSIGIWILTNTKESRSFRLFRFSSNNEDGLSIMINSERTVKITQSLIEESLALWMDCIVLSKENEDYRVFNWLQMLRRLISESLGEITMTLIVELMTFNDPLMMIDSVLNSSESLKQHFQLLSLYHTAMTSTIRESMLING